MGTRQELPAIHERAIALRLNCAFTAGVATVALRNLLPPGDLYLTGYQVDGVDVLAGVPTLPWIRFRFDLPSAQRDMEGNTGDGIIAPLQEVRTTQMALWDYIGTLPWGGRTLTITAEAPNGTTPLITNALFLCRYVPRNTGFQ